MIICEKMSESHVPCVAALERLCFSAPWSEASIRSELTNPLSLWFVALDDGAVVGYIGSQAVLDEADMMNLAVAPSCRRNGVGRKLTQALICALQEKGIRTLTLEVRKSNEAAAALYQSLGFVTVGCRPGYYTKPKEDALILRKELLK